MTLPHRVLDANPITVLQNGSFAPLTDLRTLYGCCCDMCSLVTCHQIAGVDEQPHHWLQRLRGSGEHTDVCRPRSLCCTLMSQQHMQRSVQHVCGQHCERCVPGRCAAHLQVCRLRHRHVNAHAIVSCGYGSNIEGCPCMCVDGQYVHCVIVAQLLGVCSSVVRVRCALWVATSRPRLSSSAVCHVSLCV